MNFVKSFYFNLDRLFCGHTQIPATLLINISDTVKALSVARLRCYTLLLLFVELVSYFFITYSFYQIESIIIFSSAVFCKVFATIYSSKCQNESGVIWSLELQNYLKHLRTHSQEIQAILANEGCSEAEINSLSTLPSEIYQTEINSYQRTFLLNIGIPIFCGLALLANGDFLIAIIVIGLGLLSFPIGEKFFKEHSFRSESQLRIARSAEMTDYILEVYKKHISLTTKINFLSQIPLIVFCIRFISSGGSELLANFFALTQGLVGLSGTLAFQRLRINSLRVTQIGKHLIEVFNSHSFIISPQRWKEHVKSSHFLTSKQKNNFSNGLAFFDFTAKIELHKKKWDSLPALNIAIPYGGVAILQAPSGFGKSTFLLALLHLIEHTGDLYFVSQNEWVNAHTMTQEALKNRFFFIREEGLEKNFRLIDIFKEPLINCLASTKKEMSSKFGSTMTGLAWNASDNLIEHEIKNMTLGKSSVFSNNMKEDLENMREKRIHVLSECLKSCEGNLSTSRIYPERVFSTLSAGEKRRIITLLAHEMSKANQSIKMVILDEPLAHLDEENLNLQIHEIQKIQTLPNPPSVLIISHHFIEEIKEKLHDVQYVKFI